MGKIDFKSVNKLRNDNYPNWKLQVSLLLKMEDVWEVVSGKEPHPAEDDGGWLKKDIKAMGIITNTLTEKQSSHIYSCENAKAVGQA